MSANNIIIIIIVLIISAQRKEQNMAFPCQALQSEEESTREVFFFFLEALFLEQAFQASKRSHEGDVRPLLSFLLLSLWGKD